MKRRVLIRLALIVLIVGTGVIIFPPTRLMLVGIFKREPFYRGRPVGYWAAQARSRETTLLNLNLRGEVDGEKDRNEAWEALAGMGAGAVPELVKMLREDDPQIRQQACVTLAVIGEPAKPAIPALTALLQGETNRTRECVNEVLFVFAQARQLEKSSAARTQAKVAAMTCVRAAEALGRIDPAQNENTICVLVDALKFTDHDGTQLEGLKTLLELDKDKKISIAALAEASRESDVYVRRNAAELRWRIDRNTKELVPALLLALQDSRVHVRRAAFRGKDWIWKEPEATVLVPALSLVLHSSEDWTVREGAALALAEIGPPAKEAVPALLAMMNERDSDPNHLAAQALDKIAPDLRPGLRLALRQKTSPAYLAAQKALEQFRTGGKLTDEPAAAVPAIIDLLKDRNAQVRIEAARFLPRVGSGSKEGIRALAVALKDENAEVRREAAGSMRFMGPQAKTALPELMAAMVDTDLIVRLHAIGSTTALGASAKEAVPSLVKLYKEADSYTSRAAGTALQTIDPKAARFAGVQ